MEDWKIRQELYHRLNTVHDDDLNDKHIINTDNIVTDAVRYFKEDNLGWIYPSKSYMVAICYARWLSEEFGDNPIDYLNDIDLLFGNDPYFMTYDEDTVIYNQILDYIGGWQFNETKGYVPDVKSYFLKEFMINCT
jgi:GR25 family glycosyltransferase involved in LPS biosynthesis